LATVASPQPAQRTTSNSQVDHRTLQIIDPQVFFLVEQEIEANWTPQTVFQRIAYRNQALNGNAFVTYCRDYMGRGPDRLL